MFPLVVHARLSSWLACIMWWNYPVLINGTVTHVALFVQSRQGSKVYELIKDKIVSCFLRSSRELLKLSSWFFSACHLVHFFFFLHIFLFLFPTWIPYDMILLFSLVFDIGGEKQFVEWLLYKEFSFVKIACSLIQVILPKIATNLIIYFSFFLLG